LILIIITANSRDIFIFLFVSYRCISCFSFLRTIVMRPRSSGTIEITDANLKDDDDDDDDDAGARRAEDERPSPRSRLEQLFDDRPASSGGDAAPTRRRSPDVAESRLPRAADNAGGGSYTEQAETEHTRTNSFTVAAGSVSPLSA